MTDQSGRVEDLCLRMRESLPLQAWLKPSLLARLQEGDPSTHLPVACRIVGVNFYGNEFGISCSFVFCEEGRPTSDQERFTVADFTVVVPLTSLNFDTQTPLGHEIAAYQEHPHQRRSGR